MSKILVLLLMLTSANAMASQVTISNLGHWRMEALSQKTDLFGNAQVLLALPSAPGQYTPTVLVETVATPSLPTTIEEWRNLLGIPPSQGVKDRIVISRGRTRYLAEFKKDVGGDRDYHSLYLAEVVGQTVYLLSFQNHPKTFAANVKKVRVLFDRIRLIDTSGRRI